MKKSMTKIFILATMLTLASGFQATFAQIGEVKERVEALRTTAEQHRCTEGYDQYVRFRLILRHLERSFDRNQVLFETFPVVQQNRGLLNDFLRQYDTHITELRTIMDDLTTQIASFNELFNDPAVEGIASPVNETPSDEARRLLSTLGGLVNALTNLKTDCLNFANYQVDPLTTNYNRDIYDYATAMSLSLGIVANWTDLIKNETQAIINNTAIHNHDLLLVFDVRRVWILANQYLTDSTNQRSAIREVSDRLNDAFRNIPSEQSDLEEEAINLEIEAQMLIATMRQVCQISFHIYYPGLPNNGSNRISPEMLRRIREWRTGTSSNLILLNRSGSSSGNNGD